MVKNDYTEMIKNEQFSQVPLTRKEHINSYISVMKAEIKETADRTKLESIYHEIVTKCKLENIEVPEKLTRAILAQNSSVQLEEPKHLEGVRFDEYSILPHVRKKQYEENQRTIKTLQEITEYSADELYARYRDELRSGQPDRNILNALEARREDIRASAKGVIDMAGLRGYLPLEVTRQYGDMSDTLSAMSTRLGVTEHPIKTRFSSNKKVRARQIEDEFDIIRYRSIAQGIIDSTRGADRFDKRIARFREELSLIDKNRREGAFARYLEGLIEDTKREAQENEVKIESYKKNEEIRAREGQRREEIEAQRKAEKEAEDAREASERAHQSSLAENMMHSDNVFGL